LHGTILATSSTQVVETKEDNKSGDSRMCSVGWTIGTSCATHSDKKSGDGELELRRGEIPIVRTMDLDVRKAERDRMNIEVGNEK
jgi:hypothetical protein